MNKEVSENFKKIIEAIVLIKKLPENIGKIKCPKCGNDLHYTRAKLNGHIWGKCKTKDCLSWAQ